MCRLVLACCVLLACIPCAVAALETTPENCLKTAMEASVGHYKAQGKRLNKDSELESTNFSYVTEWNGATLTYSIGGKKSGAWSLTSGKYTLTIFGPDGKRSFPVRFSCTDSSGSERWQISEYWEIDDETNQGSKWEFRQKRIITTENTDVQTEIRKAYKNAPFIILSSYHASRTRGRK